MLLTNTSRNVISEALKMSEMFDYRHREDIKKCFNLLAVFVISPPEEMTEIHINNKDGLIDLSPCIGTYQEISL